ncbi:hypothetical protein [Erwinia sp. Leaf53]|uniref:hypothetical protein n=1 Tax=Erwinia sp. Leaf53 TaxID=1736225 RepID=UPI000700880C|nr:hypothetical protein [Erwinia sp. Leaf53]KQN56712.1 hypothetical protein ASF13_06215 [Erwinia sp. Leaf53]
MAFPSPATDYAEKELCLNELMIAHTSDTTMIHVPGRILVVDRSLQPEQGDKVAFELFGSGYVGKLMGGALITEDGEAIEGQALEDVQLLGVVTWVLHETREWLRPTI